MKVVNITVANHYGDPLATVSLYDEAATISLNLKPEEAQELLALALRIFERRQQDIAKSIADMKPAVLPAPGVTDGEYREVDNDIPF